MEVAGATEIGVLLDGGLVSAPSRSLVTEAIGDDGGDALVGERADREGAGGDRLGGDDVAPRNYPVLSSFPALVLS